MRVQSKGSIDGMSAQEHIAAMIEAVQALERADARRGDAGTLPSADQQQAVEVK